MKNAVDDVVRWTGLASLAFATAGFAILMKVDPTTVFGMTFQGLTVAQSFGCAAATAKGSYNAYMHNQGKSVQNFFSFDSR